MKLFLKPISLLCFFMPTLCFCNSNDSINFNDVHQYNSLNYKGAVLIGTELGFSGNIEYENLRWGKIILHTELAGIDPGPLIFDIGLGYGYGLYRKKGFYIYGNGKLTYNEFGLKSVTSGFSALAELEFKKRWYRYSLSLTPFYRKQLSNEILNLEKNPDHSFGLNIAFVYSFFSMK